MHELALGQAIANTVSRRADGRDVLRVTVRIGHFRQVVPDALQFAWAMLTEGSHLAGCQLEIQHIPAVIACRPCGKNTTLDVPILMCPACDTTDVELISGEEFLIATMDLAEPDRTMSDRMAPGPMNEVR